MRRIQASGIPVLDLVNGGFERAPRGHARLQRCELETMLRLFRVYVSASVAALLASEFILIYSCYLAATSHGCARTPGSFLADDSGWLRILIVVSCLMLGIYFHDLYSNAGHASQRTAPASGRGGGDRVPDRGDAGLPEAAATGGSGWADDRG